MLTFVVCLSILREFEFRPGKRDFIPAMENPAPVVVAVSRTGPAFDPFPIRAELSLPLADVVDDTVTWPSDDGVDDFWSDEKDELEDLTDCIKSLDSKTDSTSDDISLLKSFVHLRGVKRPPELAPVTPSEIFALIRSLKDPEHTALTLEQLLVVKEELITVDNVDKSVVVRFTPTIPHCSQATVIGLMIRVQLLWLVPDSFSICVKITEGTHNNETSINKQLADKERVQAALENPNVLRVVLQGVSVSSNEDVLWCVDDQ